MAHARLVDAGAERSASEVGDELGGGDDKLFFFFARKINPRKEPASSKRSTSSTDQDRKFHGSGSEIESRGKGSRDSMLQATALQGGGKAKTVDCCACSPCRKYYCRMSVVVHQ